MPNRKQRVEMVLSISSKIFSRFCGLQTELSYLIVSVMDKIVLRHLEFVESWRTNLKIIKPIAELAGAQCS